MRFPASVVLVAVVVAFGASGGASGLAGEPAAQAILQLTNGDFLPGELRGSDDPTVVLWRSPAFARPFEFPIGMAKAVHFPTPANAPKASGEFGVELVNDDIVFGNLLSWSDAEIELESARFGRLHVSRDQIRRINRLSGADSVYLGPNGLTGWSEPQSAQNWRDEGGQLFTDQPRATLFGDLGLPEKCVIELEISWKTAPDFVLALGVNDKVASLTRAFRIEVWDGQLVVVGESARDADIAVIQPAPKTGGQARIQVFLDQRERRLILLSRSGKTLATLKIADKELPSDPGLRLTNKKGDVRLEYLRIGRWDGRAPQDVREDQSRVQKTDGSIVYGQITAYDAKAKQFTIRDGASEIALAPEAISEIYLAQAPPGKQNPAQSKGVRMIYRDGSRCSGQVVRIEDDHITVNCAGIKEPLRLPLAEARSLIALLPSGEIPSAPAVGRVGRLELENVKLTGRLVSDQAQPDASLLVWQPDLSRNSSSLHLGKSGRIVYRDPPPTPKVQRAEPEPPDAFGGMMRNMWSSKPPSPAGPRPAMHLRTGDTVPCEVTRIDEKGVTFQAPQTDATFVAHDKIKSLELIPTRNPPTLDETKRDRLLTLPRMQRDSPPTHLICSRNGDILRGRIVEMDASRLLVEVRLEAKEIPRERIAQIIWLHPEELKDQAVAAGSADTPRQTRVQAIDSTGNRLTFILEKSDAQAVAGTSEVLKSVRVNLTDIDQLLFGSFIEQSAAQLAYHSWKLHHALDPKFAQADGSGSADSASTGLESSLVGQVAPAFQLDLLDGSRFKLAERKGKIVILDFWATWCGPCMQYMPQVEEVAREFVDQGVQLIAVNMEEQPEAIKSMLERHKMKMTVALDRDGAVAGKFSVTAIPQTVVIDREGKVARLYVGGGKGTADALRKALQDLVAK